MMLYYCKKAEEKSQKMACERLCEFCAGYTKGFHAAYRKEEMQEMLRKRWPKPNKN